MKKIFTLISGVVLLSGVTFGQTQRLLLAEEFTGETCGPCAANNPGYNAKLDANASKIVSIKYQNNIPSNGPNFYAYNTADISNRTAFYANNYSPHAFIDGNVWDGNAGALSVATITARYAVPSPFEIEVTHSFSPTYDIIYTRTVVRAVQAVNSANALKLRVAVTEKNTYGYTSPNGESEYSHVMRKMLPNGTGTTLPSVWAVGDSVVTDLQWTMTPGNLPNIFWSYWPMLEVVSFVQADVTREVMQVGKSHADPSLIVDAAITNASPAFSCSPSVSPVITVTNYEGNPVTSMDIEFGLTGQGTSTYNWTGSLAAGATSTITLPSITPASTGIYTFVANITSVNGSTFLANINNNKSVQMGFPGAMATSLTQAFTPTTFPPVNWILENPDNSATWSRSSAGLNGAGSAKIDFYNSAAGNIDILDIVEPLDLTNATSANLVFDVAHKQYSAAYSDNLKFEVSTDCGLTWTAVYNKSGAALSTSTGYLTTAFTPTATQWRNEVVSLSNYLGQSNVIMRIKATSAYGNNCYVDNINVTTTTGINDVKENLSYTLTNPVTDEATIALSLKSSEVVTFEIVNSLGQVVLTEKVNGKAGANTIKLDVSSMAAGSYYISASIADGKIMKPLVKQ